MAGNLELLREIQDGAVSPSTSVSELLRRCQLLAARAGIPELGDWVRHELNGYPVEVPLPEYRIAAGVAKGHFLGPFGSGIRNAILPANNLPEEYRDWARKAYLRQPIAALEDVLRQDKRGTLSVVWPGDLIARVHDRFYENMSLGQAWLELARSDFLAAVESVRNRILSFSIDAQPHIRPDEATPGATASETLAHVFHNHIYGSVGNLAQGSANVSQYSGVAPGDIGGLLRELRQLGVADDDTKALEEAVKADGPAPKKKLGTKVAAWMGTMIGKAFSGAWGVTTSTATTVLPKLLERYYGIDA
jgi:hypothetical protein